LERGLRISESLMGRNQQRPCRLQDSESLGRYFCPVFRARCLGIYLSVIKGNSSRDAQATKTLRPLD
jgi:hypothetical protein